MRLALRLLGLEVAALVAEAAKTGPCAACGVEVAPSYTDGICGPQNGENVTSLFASDGEIDG